MQTHPTALVTGATSGIGREFAVQYAVRSHDLVLVARREAELTALAAELSETHGIEVTALPCDLGDPAARAALLEEIASRGLVIDVLVNNAGFGAVGPFAEETLERTTGMVELNCQAVVELAHALLPGMLERHRGTIINVASTASFQPLPRFSVYAATKAFVLSFTRGLAGECQGTGVDVIAICPGPTSTQFFEVAHAPQMMASMRRTPAQVVATTFAGLEKGRHVVVDGLANRVGAVLGRFAPDALLTRIADLGLRRG